MQTKMHFIDRPEDNDRERFTPTTGWTPLAGKSTGLDSFLTATKEEILDEVIGKCQKNLTKEEMKALKELRENDTVEIKPADKGGCIVIMDRKWYEEKCLRQLGNREHYMRTGTDQTNSVAKRISNYLKECKKSGKLPERIVDWLNPISPRTALFYILPKIHKAGNPGRPIISANECPTERISIFVDHYIRPLAKKVPSYVKDTGHLLEILHDLGQLRKGMILVTIDVSALYTSIPHIDGLEALEEALNAREVQDPPTEVLITLAKLILQNNVFRFNKTHYRQTQGTAMGTRMAPSYAILFMAKLESKILDREDKPAFWIRFIDDILMGWLHGEESLLKFLEEINQIHPTIKFTYEYSRNSVNFLDVKITLDKDGYLHTDLFTKPTDSHAYLTYSSCHPRHIVNSIPYSQALRMLRICSDETSQEKALRDLSENLAKRNFPRALIKRSIDKAKHDIVNPTRREERREGIPLILTYHPERTQAKQTIKKYEKLTSTDPLGERYDQLYMTMLTYRRPKNLRDLLVHSDFVRPMKMTMGMTTCGKLCSSCTYIEIGQRVTSSANGYTFELRGTYSCTTSFIIYMITCSLCKKQYVGQSSNSLHQRMIAHVMDIRKKTETSVAKHFNEGTHSLTNLKVSIICQTYRNLNSRLRHEEAWIRLMKTAHPSGLNIMK